MGVFGRSFGEGLRGGGLGCGRGDCGRGGFGREWGDKKKTPEGAKVMVE